MHFTGICLITKDVKTLSHFYADVLGTEAEGDETHASLKLGEFDIAIFSIEGMEKMAPGSMQGAGYGSFTVNFQVQNVDKEYERISSKGIGIVMPPRTHPWGSRSFWFRDPDGNIVNFFGRVE